MRHIQSEYFGVNFNLNLHFCLCVCVSICDGVLWVAVRRTIRLTGTNRGSLAAVAVFAGLSVLLTLGAGQSFGVEAGLLIGEHLLSSTPSLFPRDASSTVLPSLA